MNRSGRWTPNATRDAGFDCVTLAAARLYLLLVTHDVSEAVAMADRVLLLKREKLVWI